MSLFVSWYALTAKSVDLVLALLLGCRYRQIVTLSRQYLVQPYGSLGLSRYWQYRNFLIQFRWMENNLVLCVIASSFCYCFPFSSTCETTKLEFITIIRSNRDNPYHLIHSERERQCLAPCGCSWPQRFVICRRLLLSPFTYRGLSCK